MDAPKYQAPPVDPAVAQVQQQAGVADSNAASAQAGIDTASLMARYGTRLAMAGQAGGAAAPPQSALAAVMNSAVGGFGRAA